MQKINPAHSQPLFDVAATRRMEHLAASALPAASLGVPAGSERSERVDERKDGPKAADSAKMTSQAASTRRGARTSDG